MGVSKVMLPFGPEPMLARVIRVLGDVVEPVVVVGSPGQELPPLPRGVLLARDRIEGEGPLEGIRAGLDAIQAQVDAVYVTACDAPLMVSAFVRRMIELLGDHQIVVPTEDRFFYPLAAVYRTNVLPNVEALLAARRMRPVFLFDEADVREVPVNELREVDSELSTLHNLNTPKEYLGALERAGFEAPAEVLEKLVPGAS
jgi:molybdopterin-guanine dinucleotide biosynthesis protein A